MLKFTIPTVPVGTLLANVVISIINIQSQNDTCEVRFVLSMDPIVDSETLSIEQPRREAEKEPIYRHDVRTTT